MRRRESLRSAAGFRRVLTSGSSVPRPDLVMYYATRAGASRPRFGFVVSRRIGGAVARNRVKRLLREATRVLAPRLNQPVDVVVVARPAIVRARLADIRDALTDGARGAGLIDRETT